VVHLEAGVEYWQSVIRKRVVKELCAEARSTGHKVLEIIYYLLAVCNPKPRAVVHQEQSEAARPDLQKFAANERIAPFLATAVTALLSKEQVPQCYFKSTLQSTLHSLRSKLTQQLQSGTEDEKRAALKMLDEIDKSKIAWQPSESDEDTTEAGGEDIVYSQVRWPMLSAPFSLIRDACSSD
jgi:hypothetical protein